MKPFSSGCFIIGKICFCGESPETAQDAFVFPWTIGIFSFRGVDIT